MLCIIKIKIFTLSLFITKLLLSRGSYIFQWNLLQLAVIMRFYYLRSYSIFLISNVLHLIPHQTFSFPKRLLFLLLFPTYLATFCVAPSICEHSICLS